LLSLDECMYSSIGIRSLKMHYRYTQQYFAASLCRNSKDNLSKQNNVADDTDESHVRPTGL